MSVSWSVSGGVLKGTKAAGDTSQDNFYLSRNARTILVFTGFSPAGTPVFEVDNLATLAGLDLELLGGHTFLNFNGETPLDFPFAITHRMGDHSTGIFSETAVGAPFKVGGGVGNFSQMQTILGDVDASTLVDWNVTVFGTAGVAELDDFNGVCDGTITATYHANGYADSLVQRLNFGGGQGSLTDMAFGNPSGGNAVFMNITGLTLVKAQATVKSGDVVQTTPNVQVITK